MTEARRTVFQPGTLPVFDRGYGDYNWWLKLTREGVNFVTRLKDSAHRPWRSVFYTTLERCRAEALTRGQRKFRFKHKLLSLDASMAELRAESFDWARYKRSKGRSACKMRCKTASKR